MRPPVIRESPAQIARLIRVDAKIVERTIARFLEHGALARVEDGIAVLKFWTHNMPAARFLSAAQRKGRARLPFVAWKTDCLIDDQWLETAPEERCVFHHLVVLAATRGELVANGHDKRGIRRSEETRSEETTDVPEAVRRVIPFLDRFEDWPHDPGRDAEWLSTLMADFPGVDYARQIPKAADWAATAKKPVKNLRLFVRNWIERAHVDAVEREPERELAALSPEEQDRIRLERLRRKSTKRRRAK